MSADDFEPLKVIGRGAFGEVEQIYSFNKNKKNLFRFVLYKNVIPDIFMQ